MEFRGVTYIILGIMALLEIQICTPQEEVIVTRTSFPVNFTFGTSSSAYQYEGAVDVDGRGASVWDTFSHSSEKIVDFSTADVTVDQYNRYEEDIQLMDDMGVDSYKFSISWSRIYPGGCDEVNQAGIDHYNKLIDSLLAKGIEPYVTLYHWDLPQALEDKYNGWLSSEIIKDFTNYAETCFQQFGDRVKNWITFNDPHTFATQGYDVGIQAPGRCSVLLHMFCKAGNSATEPYIVAHNVLLAHAQAAHIYKKKYKSTQKGSLGISLDAIWFEPLTNSQQDIEAAQRAQDFQLGWFLDPLMFGDYPYSMKCRVGSRLPKFTPLQSALVNGSLDFVGINHYTTYFAKHNTSGIIENLMHDSLADSGVITIPFNGTKAIAAKANSLWLYIVPQSMRSLMIYIKEKYGNPPVVITENGMDDPNSPFIPIEQAVQDEKRIKYHNDYLANLASAIKDGCNVKGYFIWSLLDNWEWEAGYTSRFGLHYVDYNDNLKRYPKHSAKWYKNFLKSTCV